MPANHIWTITNTKLFFQELPKTTKQYSSSLNKRRVLRLIPRNVWLVCSEIRFTYTTVNLVTCLSPKLRENNNFCQWCFYSECMCYNNLRMDKMVTTKNPKVHRPCNFDIHLRCCVKQDSFYQINFNQMNMGKHMNGSCNSFLILLEQTFHSSIQRGYPGTVRALKCGTWGLEYPMSSR